MKHIDVFELLLFTCFAQDEIIVCVCMYKALALDMQCMHE